MSGKEKRCETCFNYLGGIYACCRMNLEKECREGDYEAWEPKRKEVRINDEGPTETERPVPTRH